MPTFDLLNFKDLKNPKNKNMKPIAIIKGDDRNKLYNKFLCVDANGNKGKTKIDLPDDLIFQVLPDTNENKRNVYYSAGMSGSGKSYQAKIIANNYYKMYPDRDIYVISKLDSDETLDSMEKAPIRLNYKEFGEKKPDINNFSNSFVIFDDYDTIEPKKLRETIQNFIDDIAIMGRKHSDEQGCISMFCASHYLTNYKSTRLILNECDNMILFPQNTSAHALRYVLKNYAGLDPEDIKKLKKLGRWVCIHKIYPQYILSSQTAYMLHQDDD